MDDNFLTRAELARLLRCSIRTIYTYEKSGAIPAATKVGRRHLWSRQDLLTFLKSAVTTAASPGEPNQ